MTIRLSPEIEALIREDVERGPYRSANEFVAEAVRQLHQQERWLAENRPEIAEQIEHGYAQAEQGELIDGEAAFEELRRRHQRRLG